MALVRPLPYSRPWWARRDRPMSQTRFFAWLAAVKSGDNARTTRGDETLAARERDFEAFFHQHEHDIFTYLWRLTGDEASAYDLAQETFLRAWKHYDKVATYDRPGGWLFRVATNLALNFMRQRRSPWEAVTLDERDHTADDPARRVVESDQVRRALMALGPRPRAALVLREVYGLTGEELAAALSISAGAARVLLWRARATFRDCYLGDSSTQREEGGR